MTKVNYQGINKEKFRFVVWVIDTFFGSFSIVNFYLNWFVLKGKTVTRWLTVGTGMTGPFPRVNKLIKSSVYIMWHPIIRQFRPTPNLAKMQKRSRTFPERHKLHEQKSYMLLYNWPVSASLERDKRTINDDS